MSDAAVRSRVKPNMSDIRLAVVIMTMRLGSTWFTTTYLAQHPQVHLISGEMCHGVPQDACGVKRFDAALDECRRAREKKPTVTTCMYKAPAWFWGSNRSADAFAENAHYFATQRAQVIHLYRRNMLKQAVSLSDTTSSHTWGIPTATNTTVPTTTSPRVHQLDAKQVLHAFLFYHLGWHASCRFVEHVLPGPRSPPALEVAYEDLSSLQRRGATLGRVYDSLGLTQVNPFGMEDTRARRSSDGGALDFKQVMLPGEDAELMRLLRSGGYMTKPYNVLTQGLSDDDLNSTALWSEGDGRLGEFGACWDR